MKEWKPGDRARIKQSAFPGSAEDCDLAARGLISKGMITEVEYLTALAEEAEAEQRRYEELLSQRHGATIRLA